MRKLIATLLVFQILFAACEKEEGLSYLNSKEISDIGTQEEDKVILSELYNEILSLSNEEPCTEPNECDYVEIGLKPCGEPGGYIAYSTNINVNEFLEKVHHYNQQQNTFNLKWQLDPGCNVPPEPSGIICEDGEAILIYDSE